jgi:hypothetical protein
MTPGALGTPGNSRVDYVADHLIDARPRGDAHRSGKLLKHLLGILTGEQGGRPL